MLDSNPEVPTSTNEAYGKVASAANDPNYLYDNVIIINTDSDIPTSQNAAYGDVPTSTTTNNEEDYYTNEGLNNPGISMMKNEAYGDISGQSSSSHVTGSLDGTSIPTTRNEAYTSVSTNTERVDTEETYDYVRYL